MKERSLSSKLRLYGKVYSEYVKSNKKTTEIVEVPRVKKSLTEYQKFVRDEAKKEKYGSLKPEERMVKIAKAWKKQLKKSESSTNVKSTEDRRRTRQDPEQVVRGHSKTSDVSSCKKRKETRKKPESPTEKTTTSQGTGKKRLGKLPIT
jgi:hypothetical protein